MDETAKVYPFGADQILNILGHRLFLVKDLKKGENQGIVIPDKAQDTEAYRNNWYRVIAMGPLACKSAAALSRKDRKARYRAGLDMLPEDAIRVGDHVLIPDLCPRQHPTGQDHEIALDESMPIAIYREAESA